MVQKATKSGIASGNSFKVPNCRYLRRYAASSLIIRRVIEIPSDFRQSRDYDTGLGDIDLQFDGVPYSLNKKGRWLLPAVITEEIVEGDHRHDDFGLQLVQRYKIRKSANAVSDIGTRVAGGRRTAKTHGYFNRSLLQDNPDCRAATEACAKQGDGDSGPGASKVRGGAEDWEPEHGQTQIIYDVLYPLPCDASLNRDPKSIRFESNSYYKRKIYVMCRRQTPRRNTSRRWKHISKDIVEEAIEDVGAIGDESTEEPAAIDNIDAIAADSTEEPAISNDEMESVLGRPIIANMADLFEQAKSTGKNTRPKRKTQRKSDRDRRHDTQHQGKGFVVILHETDDEGNSANKDVNEHEAKLAADESRVKSNLEGEGVSPSPSKLLSTLLKPTSLEPVIVVLPFDVIEPRSLVEKFGDNYLESACFPRKFILDISDRVSGMDKFKENNSRSRAVNACLVIQVDRQDEMFKPGERVCRVVLNTNFRRNLGEIKIDHISAYRKTSLDRLINRTIDFIDKLPYGTVLQNANTASYYKDTVKRSIVEELKNWSTTSYKVDDSFFLKYFFSNFRRSKANSNLADRTMGYARLKLRQYMEYVRLKMTHCSTNHFIDDSKYIDNYCGICFTVVLNENIATALTSCSHWFCNSCWRQHIETQISINATIIHCPENDCESKVDDGTIISFVSMTSIMTRAKCCLDTEVGLGAWWIWCPNGRCGRALRLSCVDVGMATCACGESFCVDCGRRPHWPADCGTARSYHTTLVATGDAGLLPTDARCEVTVHGKFCPRCRRFIEKHGGCHQATCVCGVVFCWTCGKDFSSDVHAACYRTPSMFNDNVGTVAKTIDPEDRLRVLKRRKWYKMALMKRLAQHPKRHENMLSFARALGRNIRKAMARSERKGIAETSDHQIEGKKLSRESDKVPEFINSMLDLYKEVSRLAEFGAVVLDSKCDDLANGHGPSNANSKLAALVKRFHNSASQIYDQFLYSHERNAMATFKRLKRARQQSKEAIQTLVKLMK